MSEAPNDGNGQPDQYVVAGPHGPAPGGIGLLALRSSLPVLDRLQAEPKETTYRVRSYLSSAYDLSYTGRDALSGNTKTLIRLSRGERRCRIWTHRQPVCFVLEPGEDGYLQSVTGFARASLPLEALRVFNTAVALLLDQLVTKSDIPLYVRRTELELDQSGHKLIQVVFPSEYAPDIAYDVGYYLPVFFLTYWSLEREALSSPSPIYRFMCRWRAFESIGPTRKAIREFASRVGCSARMPKPPRLTDADRAQLGLTDTSSEERTFHDVVERYRDLRDAVAHLWSNDSHVRRKGTVLPFRSWDVETCESGSRVIGICNRRSMAPLSRFFEEHLEHCYMLGHILPLDGSDERFCATKEALRLK